MVYNFLFTGNCWLWYWFGSNGENFSLNRYVAFIVVASILPSLSFSFPPLRHLYPAHFLMAFLMLYCLHQGNRAVAEIQFADYIYPAFDQACLPSSCFRV